MYFAQVLLSCDVMIYSVILHPLSKNILDHCDQFILGDLYSPYHLWTEKIFDTDPYWLRSLYNNLYWSAMCTETVHTSGCCSAIA